MKMKSNKKDVKATIFSNTQLHNKLPLIHTYH